MFKRSIKLYIGWFLVVFIAMGLTISTLHSHHNLEWHQHHPEELADTGNCISPDTSHCPVCGYILKSNLPSPATDGSTFYSSKEISTPEELFPTYIFEVAYKGRSPPVTG